jgi:hypothetical protein
MKVVFILAVAAVAANLFFIWYAKRKGHTSKSDKSSLPGNNTGSDSQEFLDSEEGKALKQSAAEELCISVEELECMSVDEIKQLAKKKELIQN